MKLSTFDILKHSQPEGSFYLDDGQLRRLQAVLSAMLRDIAAIAEENGITVTLGGGTLLGAVRYGGFIPWDDDIDLNVPRADHDRLVRLLEERYGDRYWVHRPDKTHDFGILSTRVRKKGTSLRMREDGYSDEWGVTIDLFPIENTYDNPVLRRLHGLLCMGMGFLLSCRKFFRDRARMGALIKGDPALRRTFAVKTAIGFLTAWGSVDFWTRAADRCYRLCRDDRSEYVVVPSGRKHFSGELYRRESFCALRRIRFGDGLYNCTADIDGYMTHLYGDYRTAPPADRQERHVFFTFQL